MSLARLRTFVTTVTRTAETASGDDQRLRAARRVLAELVGVDAWLPDVYAAPDKQYYRQYLLHCDPLERFLCREFRVGAGPVHPDP
jgi:3-mercaptopropionate dioxygenase